MREDGCRGNLSRSFSGGTTQIHSIQLSRRSMHTGVPVHVHVLRPSGMSECRCVYLWSVAVVFCIKVLCIKIGLDFILESVTMCSLSANNDSQPPLKHQHAEHLWETDPLHGDSSCIVWSFVFEFISSTADQKIFSESNLQTAAKQASQHFHCAVIHPSTHGTCFVTLHVCTRMYVWTDRGFATVARSW